MRRLRLWFIGIFITFLFPWLQSSIAQEKNTIATSQDIAIAYYKTAGIQPPFETWVKSQSPYKTTPLARRPEILEREVSKLIQKYQDYSPFQDVLKIRINAKFITTIEEDAETNQKKYFGKIDVGRPLNNFYLPYSYNDQNFMIVPSHINHFEKIPLTQSEFTHINKYNNAAKNNPYFLGLIIKTVDMTQPYMMDGKPQWLMAGDIVTMDIWNNAGKLIWQYTTTGHVPENLNKIQKLYKKNE